MSKMILATTLCILLASTWSTAQAEDPVFTLCKAGECTALPPEIGVLILLASTFEENINKNIEANDESGELAKALKVISGISVKDIEKYGLCGGKNAEVRKLLGNLCPDNTK